MYIFTNSYLFEKKYFFFLTYWGNFNHLSQQVAKKIIQTFICMKKLFWGKKNVGLM
jgi:hypothetical protein